MTQFIIVGFRTDQTSSVFYRKYKKPCSLADAVQKLVGSHAVDVISIRVIGRRKALKLTDWFAVELEDEPVERTVGAHLVSYHPDDVKSV